MLGEGVGVQREPAADGAARSFDFVLVSRGSSVELCSETIEVPPSACSGWIAPGDQAFMSSAGEDATRQPFTAPAGAMLRLDEQGLVPR